MADKVSLTAAFGMEPKDAVAYFRSKGYQVSDQWHELDAAAHSRAFTVAKAMRMDVLEDIRQSVDQALAEGLTQKQFADQLAPQLKAKGWWGKQVWGDAQGNNREVQLGSPWRLKNIYRNNLQPAYMAGRYRRQLATVKTHPYWQYVSIRDEHTRPSHRRMNGRVFRWDDPIWQTLYPPNGWGCRCRVRALTQRQVEREGLTVENGADYIEPVQREAGTDYRTGEVVTMDHTVVHLPDGQTMSPDVGWANNPGAGAFGVDASIAAKLGQVRSTDLRAQVVQSLNNSDLRQAQFAQWAEKVLTERRAGHELASVGFLSESLAQAVLARTGQLPARLMVIRGKDLAHADSKKHRATGVAMPLEVYKALPKLLSNPRAVLWDKQKQNLMYVLPYNAEMGYRVVVNTSWRMKKSERTPLDAVINAYQAKLSDLRNAGVYEVLEGEL